jgi:hypothetical protein
VKRATSNAAILIRFSSSPTMSSTFRAYAIVAPFAIHYVNPADNPDLLSPALDSLGFVQTGSSSSCFQHETVAARLLERS